MLDRLLIPFPDFPPFYYRVVFYISSFQKYITGNLTQRHKEIFYKNPLFVGMRLPEVREVGPVEKKFPRMSALSLDLMKVQVSILYTLVIMHFFRCG